MKNLKFVLSIGFISTPLYAASTADIMQRALDNFIQILPYTTSEMKFTDPNNEKILKKNITELYGNFKSADHQKIIKKTTLQPSYNIMLDQLENALINFRSGNKAFARLRLNEVSHLCLSCHTQFSKSKMKTRITNNKSIQKAFKDDNYSKGNIYFILRDYNEALKAYKQTISERIVANLEASKDGKYLLPKKQFFDPKLYGSLHNSLLIYTKVLNAPKDGITMLQGYKKTYNLPDYAVKDIDDWTNQFKYWVDYNEELKESKVNSKQIDKIFSRMEKKFKNDSPLSGDFDIDLMMMSGVLTKYFHQQPNKSKLGEVLYWMAMSEYRLGKNLFYSLGDHYLRQCIEIYAKSKVAKKCFDAYEEEVLFRFTGSGGVFLPENVKKEIEELKKKL